MAVPDEGVRPDEPDERPPLFPNWTGCYVFVIVYLFLLILFLYWFTKRFGPGP